MEDSQLESAMSAGALVPRDELPTASADLSLRLTRVPVASVPLAEDVAHVLVTGLAAMVIIAGVGRWAGAPGRLTLACSVATFTATVTPRLSGARRTGSVR